MKIYNSTEKKIDNYFENQSDIKIYSCGPTVYNYVHIGNLFAFLQSDILFRWLKFGEGKNVYWVMNLTDVDDKTIRDASKKYPELSPQDALIKFTSFYTEEFFKDIEDLNIVGIRKFMKATDYINEQQDLVKKIYDAGYAYISEGSVYFDLTAYRKNHQYDKITKVQSKDYSQSRISSDEYEKNSVSDFVLWKAKKEREPSWNFEINGENLEGRPGWHLECSAMEKAVLDLPFDIHTGGCDLKFPHHTNEIAQSIAGYGVDPTTVWFHSGHLKVEGETMSKSKGNFYTLNDIKKMGIAPDAFRLAIVINHYRKDYNFTSNVLQASAKHLSDIQESYKIISNMKPSSHDKSYLEYMDSFREAMRNDLNTPQAFSIFLKFIKEIRQNPINNKSSMDFFKLALDVFGIKTDLQEEEIPEEVIKLAESRKAAKENKDFQKADLIREQIQEKGFLIKDSRDSYTLKKI